MRVSNHEYKVSIVLPTYNVEKYIAACIDSLRHQTLRDIQIIFIDDASTDGSAAIIDSYTNRDSRIILRKFDKNKGPAAARNFGLSLVDGEFVQFMDPDDLLPEDAIEKLYEAAKENGADMVRGNGVFFYDNEPGTFTPMQHVSLVTSQNKLNYRNKNFHGNPWYHVLFLFNVNFLRKNKIVYPDLRLGEDPIFLLKALMSSTNASAIPDIVYKYRASLNREDPHSDEIKVCDHFSHLITMKNLWIENNLLERWTAYFHDTFWWSWEKHIIGNAKAVESNIEAIHEIFSSLPQAYIDTLPKERYLNCCMGKVCSAREMTDFSLIEKIDITSVLHARDTMQKEIDALYRELIMMYTSRSWKLTRILRKTMRKLSYFKASHQGTPYS